MGTQKSPLEMVEEAHAASFEPEKSTGPGPGFLFTDEINSELDGADPVPQFDAIDPALIPEPVGYRVIIRPKPAAEKYGSIIAAGRSKNTDLAIRTIGQVLKLGPLAFTAKMDGMDYAQDTTAAGIKPNDWVIYRQNSGQKIKIGRKPGLFDGDEGEDQYLIILSDTDIFAAITEEQAFKFYDWVS